MSRCIKLAGLLMNSINSESGMGILQPNRVDPSLHRRRRSLVHNDRNLDISRNNFKFIGKVSDDGCNQESTTWFAENWEDPSEKFFVKKTVKTIAHENGRIKSLKNELFLLTRDNMKFLIEPRYAFQDYESLYLVTEFIDGFSLEEILREQVLKEEEAKYIILGLITMLEKIHQQKFALTELCPKNVILDRITGKLKLREIINPLPIDEFYPSDMIHPLNSYSAPEILMMDKVVAESDFYSVGLILYEIMKNKPAIQEENKGNRLQILNERIEVMKSDLPEGWRPEAADFLVKLLIKNPELRLGRFGSFEIRNHPWLQNYSWAQTYSSCGIQLNERELDQKTYQPSDVSSSLERDSRETVRENFEFQALFEGYYYRVNEAESEVQQEDSSELNSDTILEEF